eukprot:6185979-Pleurochrysis_carterae.AAC.1
MEAPKKTSSLRSEQRSYASYRKSGTASSSSVRTCAVADTMFVDSRAQKRDRQRVSSSSAKKYPLTNPVPDQR